MRRPDSASRRLAFSEPSTTSSSKTFQFRRPWSKQSCLALILFPPTLIWLVPRLNSSRPLNVRPTQERAGGRCLKVRLHCHRLPPFPWSLDAQRSYRSQSSPRTPSVRVLLDGGPGSHPEDGQPRQGETQPCSRRRGCGSHNVRWADQLGRSGQERGPRSSGQPSIPDNHSEKRENHRGAKPWKADHALRSQVARIRRLSRVDQGGART